VASRFREVLSGQCMLTNLMRSPSGSIAGSARPARRHRSPRAGWLRFVAEATEHGQCREDRDEEQRPVGDSRHGFVDAPPRVDDAHLRCSCGTDRLADHRNEETSQQQQREHDATLVTRVGRWARRCAHESILLGEESHARWSQVDQRRAERGGCDRSQRTVRTTAPAIASPNRWLPGA